MLLTWVPLSLPLPRHLYRNGGLESATVEIDLDALSDITGAASSPPFGGLGAAASGGNPLGAIAHMFGQANRQGGGADGQGRTRGRGKAKMTVGGIKVCSLCSH